MMVTCNMLRVRVCLDIGSRNFGLGGTWSTLVILDRSSTLIRRVKALCLKL